jgi:hypothetical protein
VIVLSSGDVYRANDILFRRVEGEVEPTPLTESSPLRVRLYPYRGVPVPAAYGVDWDDYDKTRCEALRTTIVWDRQHPPRHIEQSQFDYAAEDAILKHMV